MNKIYVHWEGTRNERLRMSLHVYHALWEALICTATVTFNLKVIEFITRKLNQMATIILAKHRLSDEPRCIIWHTGHMEMGGDGWVGGRLDTCSVTVCKKAALVWRAAENTHCWHCTFIHDQYPIWKYFRNMKIKSLIFLSLNFKCIPIRCFYFKTKA